MSKCGETNPERKASIVEIGASSKAATNFSTSALDSILESKIKSVAPETIGKGRKIETLLRILAFSSAAAFLVKVIATTSLGVSPFHCLKSFRSLAGARSEPCPCKGSLGPLGKHRVARCSAVIKC